MPTQVQTRRGTTAQHSTFTGAAGELTVDTDKKTVVVHDASTAGGLALLREDGSNSALALGSASAPSLKFTGDTNTGVFSPGADRVGIATGGSQRFEVDASGRVLVGTSSARTNYINQSSTYTPVFQIEGANSNTGRFISQTYGFAGSAGPIVILAKHRSDSIGGTTVVQSGDECGQISFQGSDGSEFVEAATIRVEVDGTPGANSMPGRIVLSTTASGASSPTEHMRIQQNGALKYSTDGTYGAVNGTANEIRSHHTDDALQVYALSSSFASNILLARASRNTTNNTFYGISYYNDGANAYRFRVADSGNCTNTNNSYTGISDIKLKENIVDAKSQWQDIKSLQVRNYNFKEETGQPTHRQIGLIAQEVETVCPHLVDESPDSDGDGNDLGTVTKSVNYSVLYMKAVKALQEAMERIETLETKVAALEAA